MLGDVLLDGELGHCLLSFSASSISDALLISGPCPSATETFSSHTNFDRLGLQVLGLFVDAKKKGVVSRRTLLGSTVAASWGACSHHISGFDLSCASTNSITISLPELPSTVRDLLVGSSWNPTLQLLPGSGRGALRLNVAHGDARLGLCVLWRFG